MTLDPKPPDPGSRAKADPALERRRRELDEAREASRKDLDGVVARQRKLTDSTRVKDRGDGQARAGLRRERNAVDASLGSERHEADSIRKVERVLSDATVAREKEARAHAEGDLQHSLDREVHRTKELREVLHLVRAEFDIIGANLKTVLTNVPRGSYEERLNENVERIRTAGERVQLLLGDALDPLDSRRDHDGGGSG
jgi:hypothetical protein